MSIKTRPVYCGACHEKILDLPLTTDLRNVSFPDDHDCAVIKQLEKEKTPQNMADVKRLVYEQIGYLAEANRKAMQVKGEYPNMRDFVTLIQCAEDLERAGR